MKKESTNGIRNTKEANTTETALRKRGGQPGNQNARTHGFYSRVLTSQQQQQLEEARPLLDLDEEIALLRLKVRSILQNDPENHAALLAAVSVLTRMILVNSQFKGKCFAWGGVYLEQIGRRDYMQRIRDAGAAEICKTKNESPAWAMPE